MESESSVDALIRLGHYATTWAGGSGNPPLGKLAAVLAHAIDVRIIADNDDHGRGQACALRIHAALSEAGIPTTCWIPPTVGTDVRDLINAGGSLADLAPLASPIARIRGGSVVTKFDDTRDAMLDAIALVQSLPTSTWIRIANV